MRLIILVLFICFFNVNHLFAQRNIAAHRIESFQLIDGIFDSTSWMGADSATNFTQLEPDKGSPSTEKTVVYVGFDSLNVYVFFKCYQSTPVIGKRNSRDEISKTDDAVAVTFDTYNDGRSSFGFLVNPLASQTDFRVDDDGKILDTNWDTEWESAVNVTDYGWNAELAIPFRSFKFNRKSVEWGINFARVILNNTETTYWSGIMSEDFRISQGGKLTNIHAPENDQKLVVYPYSTLQHNGDQLNVNVGGDLKWQINSNISVNATYNPDFATVEADQEQINLTRYELRYPEKRLFFQEGNSMFDTRIKTFYSRRVKDIDYGAKFNGKVGAYQVNLISAHSMEDQESADPAALYTAARVKRDFLKSSFAGITIVDKSWQGLSTHSLSADYAINLGRTWKFTGQFVGSGTTQDIINSTNSTRSDFLQNSSWYLRFARENNMYHYHIRYTDIGENFRSNVNQTGFISDDDRREVDSDVSYKWWIKNDVFKYIYGLAKNNVFWSHKGTLRSWNQSDFIKVMFANKFNLEYDYNNEFKLFEKGYYNQRHNFTAGYNTDEWSSIEMVYTTGTNFDKQLNMLSINASEKLFQKIAVEYSGKYVHFNPDPANASTFLNVLTLKYYYTNNLWLKVFAQSSSANSRIYLYGLFGWRFKPPFGSLYLIYSHDEFMNEGNVGKSTLNNLFLKLSFPIYIVK